MPVLGRDHFIVFHSPPGFPGLYVLKRWPQWDPPTIRTSLVCKAPTLEEVRKHIPEGYANTGVPDGPNMVEVWVYG